MEFIAQYGASDSEEEQFSMSTQIFYKSKTVTPKGNSIESSDEDSPKPQFDSHEVDDLQNDFSENRCNSQMSCSVSVDLADYLSNDTLELSRSPTPNNMEQDIIEHDDVEHKSDSDISIAESEFSEYVPSKDDLEMIISDGNSDEDSKPISPKPQKYKKNCKAKFDSHELYDLQSPKRMKSPNSYSTPKTGKKYSTPKSPRLGSSPKSGSPKARQSPKSGSLKSPMFGSPKARQSPIPSEIQIDDVNIYVGQVAEILKEKIKNDNDLKKYLCGNPELSSDHITTQVHQNNKCGENHRLYNKYHICYYCGKCIIKMGRHFIKQHANEHDIEKIINKNLNSPERRAAIQLLTLKGDFLHNCAVLLEQKGVLLVLRRPDANNPTEFTEYIPCMYCLGFVQKTQAYRHAKKCPFQRTEFSNIESNGIVSQGKVLLRKMTARDNSTTDWQTIQGTFRTDEVGQYILNDDTLCAWGNSLTIKCGIVQAKHIRDKLRNVGTFCKSYHKEYGTDDISVRDIFQPKNFERIFKIAQPAYGKSLTSPVKLGGFIKEIMIIIKQQAIFSGDSEKKEEIENFLYLVNTSWNLISAPNIRMLKEQKPIVVEMPITSDIRNVLHFLSGEIQKYVKELCQDPTLEIWIILSKNILAFLIVFNRRREGEVSRLKLKTYTQKPNYDEMETDTLKQTLTTIEQYLCENYSYVSTVGKRNRRVPILYPHYIEVALDSLVENREICGIKTENQFLFANTALGNMRGCDVLRVVVEKCGLTCVLQKPHLIKSTQLRKHVATIAQILVLNEEELGHISNHMGHSEAIHKGFYRQQESVIEKTHITKLLQLVNTGNIAKYKGKTLNDVSLQDIITAATEDVINDPIDNDVDDLDDEVDGDELDVDVDEPSSSTSTSNVSIDNEVVSKPSSSRSNPSLCVKPNVTLNQTSRVKTKLNRQFWPKWIKTAIKNELGECIHNINNLTQDRANAFMEKYALKERIYET